MATLSLVVILLLSGCVRYQPHGPQQVQEVLEEIDIYRGDGVFRSLDHTLSEDDSYLALADQSTTASIQFPGATCCIRLSDVFLTTMKNNRSIEVEEYNRTIAEEGIRSSKGIYDLLVEASILYTRSERQLPVRLDPNANRNGLLTSRLRQTELQFRLTQLLPSGGVLQLFTQEQFQKNYSSTPGSAGFGAPTAVDPFTGLVVGGNIRQPLLRGFGPFVTNAPILKAHLNHEIADENFRNQVINQLADAVNTYFDLVFAINNYEVQRLSLERAGELLRVTRIKVEQGVEPPNVALQAEAETSNREALVINARSAIADASDALKQKMHIYPGDEQWDYNLIPVDQPIVSPVPLNENAIYQEALLLRPDYRVAQRNLEVLEVDKRVAKNSRLPQLDATGSVSANAVGADFGEAGDNLETTDNYTYTAGLEFSYPLQNRAARGDYNAASLRVEQQLETLENLKELIRLEVRSTMRALETNLRLIHAFDSAVKSEEAKLDSQIKRYEVGASTIFEVLQFQEDLANAQVNYLQSIVDYNKQLIELQRTKGSFMQDYRTEFLDQQVTEREERESAEK